MPDSRSCAPAPSLPVAIARCPTYDLAGVTERMAKLFDQIGGVQQLVQGKTVTIKPNITGMSGSTFQGLPGERTFQTHFNVIRAAVDLLHRAGAKRIRIVESVYGHMPLEKFLANIRLLVHACRHEIDRTDRRHRCSVDGLAMDRARRRSHTLARFKLHA